MLELVLTNKERLVGKEKLKGSLGCSDHEMLEFEILKVVRREQSKPSIMNFSRCILASSGICLAKYHEIKLGREVGSLRNNNQLRKLVSIIEA